MNIEGSPEWERTPLAMNNIEGETKLQNTGPLI